MKDHSNEQKVEYGTLKYGFKLVQEVKGRDVGLIALDNKGQPAIFPMYDHRIRCVPLSSHSMKDLLLHWKPEDSKPNRARFKFLAYVPEMRSWEEFTVDLLFENDKCEKFRVFGPMEISDCWFPTHNMPYKFSRNQTNKKMSVEIFCNSGPKHLYLHQVVPLTRKEECEAVFDGKGENCLEKLDRGSSIPSAEF